MGESKQVKVDNWGIFFLQRLQHFFNKTYFCDLTLQFDDNAQLKVHRLVMNACTEYFQVLEQTCEIINDCLIMPPDLQADVVVPIVNFMYTGILEFHETIFDRLYTTARLMNMTVLTKLLDAQKVPISPIPKPMNKRSPVTPITWNLQGKRIAPKTMDPDLPEPLQGRKLPIWKRKSVPGTITYRSSEKSSIPDPLSTKYFKSSVDDTPRPTRFEWPDEDDNSFDTSSFDEISYTSKPLLMPCREKSPKPSTSNFEELKRTTSSVKRPASPVFNDNKRVNIQDVKEYLKEQKLRSDYIDYDDAEAADNDLQTYDDDDSAEESTADKDAVFDQNADDTPSRSILKNDGSASHNKRVRFSLEGKENASVKPISKPVPPTVTTATAAAAATTTTTAAAGVTAAAAAAAAAAAKAGTSVDMSNHTKIITEVLKKYPHLVKKNKNIRLKILAKGSSGGNSTGAKAPGTPVKLPKPTSKVSYMVMKPDQLATQSADKKDGQYLCHKCSNTNPLQFDTYYLYRTHLTDVHNEKIDSQMCNICGHVSRKQNMLMYHKFVKHNITPPPMYQFPKCKDCPYIALSPTLLTKHQYNHTHINLVCAECNTPFATKSQLISHLQQSGHSARSSSQTYDCGYCSKKFISDETLFQHIKKNHKVEARRDNIISSEEIDELDEQESPAMAAAAALPPQPPKEKIKILSDIKVNTPISTAGLLPVRTTVATIAPDTMAKAGEVRVEGGGTQQALEPSSEAESLSNVASGIAASLGLVNTIVVLDENQFILQSQDGGVQENIAGAGTTEFLLPEVANMDSIPNLHQVLTTDNSAIMSQTALNKNNITSTDELVMVLTDHDYSDASSSNAMLTAENSNIVVLYSHPVQGQDGQYISQPGNLMLNPDMSIMEVSNSYTVASAVSADAKPCEESIEMIQQEINNHLEHELQQHEIQTDQIIDKTLAEQIITFTDVKVQPQTEQPLVVELANDMSEKMDIDPVAELEFAKPGEIPEEVMAKILLPTTDTVVLADNAGVLTSSSAVLTDASTALLTGTTTGILTESTEMMLLTNNAAAAVASELITTTTGVLTGTTETLVDTAGVLTQNAEVTELPAAATQTIVADSAQATLPPASQQILADSAAVLCTEDTSLPPVANDQYVVEEEEEEEPMEIEESIELIEKEIAKNSPELHSVPPPSTEAASSTGTASASLEALVALDHSAGTTASQTVEPGQPDSETVTQQTQSQCETNPVTNTAAAPVAAVEHVPNGKPDEEESAAFDEPMEVDSAKVSTQNEEEIMPDNTTVAPVAEEIISADEIIVPDSEEEKSVTDDDVVALTRDEVDGASLETDALLADVTSSREEARLAEEQPIETTAIATDNGAEVENGREEETLPVIVSDEHKEESAETIDNEVTQESTETATEEEPIERGEAVDKKEEPVVDTVVETNAADAVDAPAETYPTSSPVTTTTTTITQEKTPEPVSESIKSNSAELLNALTTNAKISNLLDDWDDGDTDSQQSDAAKSSSTTTTTTTNTTTASATTTTTTSTTSADNSNSINTLINDWEDEEDT